MDWHSFIFLIRFRNRANTVWILILFIYMTVVGSTTRVKSVSNLISWNIKSFCLKRMNICKSRLKVVNKYAFELLQYALRRKGKAHKSDKKKHWLDWASDKYDEKLISNVKALLDVVVIFIPAPLFWAVFDQQVRIYNCLNYYGLM